MAYLLATDTFSLSSDHHARHNHAVTQVMQENLCLTCHARRPFLSSTPSTKANFYLLIVAWQGSMSLAIICMPCTRNLQNTTEVCTFACTRYNLKQPCRHNNTSQTLNLLEEKKESVDAQQHAFGLAMPSIQRGNNGSHRIPAARNSPIRHS